MFLSNKSLKKMNVGDVTQTKTQVFDLIFN